MEIQAERAGEADEFAQWAQPSLLAMSRLAARLAPHAEPDEIVQEALLRAWVKRDQFDPERGTASSWLLAITADLARRSRRTRHRRLRVVDDGAEVPDRPERVTDVEGDLVLDAAVDALPDRQRIAVVCHYFVGLSVDETAQVMGCAPGTVKSALFDARARLRQSLGGPDDD
jgi:RNA polymerase sigma-70 factor (ECF subfamily)